jgi:starch synthase
MKILFVVSELAPLAKTGGLADMTAELARELHGQGHDVRIALPLYKSISRSGIRIEKLGKSVGIELGGEMYKGLLRKSDLSGMPVYLIENREIFHRDELYGTMDGDYPDNALRFAFFCRGVLELAKSLDFSPDVIHCHDWQAALIPILLRYELADDPFFAHTATLFTIHNLAYQGLFPKEALPELGLDESYLTIDRLEFYGQVNLMKGAIQYADMVSTVSPTYREEILFKEQGCGLDGVLRTREDDLYGILNGLDYNEWDPEKDAALFARYGTATVKHGKKANKQGLQRLLGLPERSDIPLIGMVARLSAQKGFELIAEIAPWLAEAGLQLAVLGNGEAKYLEMFQELAAAGVENITLRAAFDPVLARQIYAGSDIFLMPSMYEPCGLGQLIALRYGAIPVVRSVGGLADTIVDPLDGKGEANGFTFTGFSGTGLQEALDRSLDAWHDGDGWGKLVQRAMSCRFSWQEASGDYLDLYQRAIAKKG